MNNIESIDRKFLKLKFIKIVVIKINHILYYLMCNFIFLLLLFHFFLFVFPGNYSQFLFYFLSKSSLPRKYPFILFFFSFFLELYIELKIKYALTLIIIIDKKS